MVTDTIWSVYVVFFAQNRPFCDSSASPPEPLTLPLAGSLGMVHGRRITLARIGKELPFLCHGYNTEAKQAPAAPPRFIWVPDVAAKAKKKNGALISLIIHTVPSLPTMKQEIVASTSTNSV